MLSLIKAKKKEGVKKAVALMKRDHRSEDDSIAVITDSSSNELINLIKDSGSSSNNNDDDVDSNIDRISNRKMMEPSSIDPQSRPSSRNSNRIRQPRLGIGISSNFFEDDPGIMSEVETSSSTSSKRSAKFRTSLAGGGRHPINIIGGRGNAFGQSPPNLSRVDDDDDPGIMSEAETSSTARMKRNTHRGGRNSIPMGSLTLTRGTSILTKPAQVSLLSQSYYQPQQQQQQYSKQGYYIKGSSSLFEDDPGIMSEAETASTGRRRPQQYQQYQLHHQNLPKKGAIGGKNSLPVVRTPSKTLERPLGLVFLIYRGETKRALLPNEITSKDTVKALFVRSFGKSLTMEYMDSPRVKIYIHDSAKDIFYELENLNEIKDRSILKLFEADSSGRGPGGLGPQGLPPITNKDEVQDDGPIKSEPEYVDSGYVKAMKQQRKAIENGDFFPTQIPGNGVVGEIGRSTTLPRNAFSSLTEPKTKSKTPNSTNNTNNGNLRQLTSSLLHGQAVILPRPESALGERSKTLGPGFMRGYHGRSSDSSSGYVSSPDGHVFAYPIDRGSRFTAIPEGRYYPGPGSTEEAKARMMHMEAQLSQLTGMVEKALKHKKAGGKKSVSFEKSVTFSDDQPPGILTTSRRSHSIVPSSSTSTSSSSSALSSTAAAVPLSSSTSAIVVGATTSLPFSSSLHSQLGALQKSTRELRQEVRVLRRLTQLQSMAMKDLVQDTYLKLREACIAFTHSGAVSGGSNHTEDLEHWRIAQDDEIFSRELADLLNNLTQLEVQVEEMRSGVISKKNKILLQDVENMALMLSQSSKSVTQLKMAFPTLETNLKGMENLEEVFKNVPEKLDNAWKRCKKLTGTLVTLKRLASVQEQRVNPGTTIDVSLSPTPTDAIRSSSSTVQEPGSGNVNKETSLDDLLDALQNYGKDPSETVSKSPSPANKLTPVPAAIKTNALIPEEEQYSPIKKSSEKQPPCPPPRNPKGNPPPPPPRTSSTLRQPVTRASSEETWSSTAVSETSSSSESINSQEGVSNILLRKANSVTGPPVPAKPVDLKSLTTKSRQDALETRHQELLTRQRQLQEQYQRLQLMQENNKNKLSNQLINNNNNNNIANQNKAETKPPEETKKVPPPLPVRNNSTKTTEAITKESAKEQWENQDDKEKDDEKNSTQIYETDII